MKNTTRGLVLVLLAQLMASPLACTSKARGNVDAQAGLDAASCNYGGATYAPGETFTVACRACSCLPSGEVDCVATACLADSGFTVVIPGGQDTSSFESCTGADVACSYSGGVLAVGESGVDGCSTYICGAGGNLTCSAGACVPVDASVSGECSLPTQVEFGNVGGFGVDDTNNILDTTGSLTVDLVTRSCIANVPACGTPCSITLATIAKDLADPEVQAVFAAGSDTLIGVRLGFGDVANFRIALGDGRRILVGYPCCRSPREPCDRPIPKSVQRLVNDLRALLAANFGCR